MNGLNDPSTRYAVHTSSSAANAIGVITEITLDPALLLDILLISILGRGVQPITPTIRSTA